MIRRLIGFGGAFLLLCGGSVLFPRVDLWASGWFYRPGAGFFLGDWAPFRIVHDDLSYAVTGFAILLVLLLLAVLFARRAILGLDRPAAVFLLLALALGPGLTVNTIFKDHWGRARPTQITAFGGDKAFSPAFVPSDQCRRNCSFPAGDPAVGFYLVSLAFLAATPRRRRWGIAGALAAGSALGVVRLAQGGHFLSDVLASGFLVYAMSWALHRLLVVEDGSAALIALLRRPSPRLRRFAGITFAAILLFLAAYFLIDQPLARALHAADPVWRAAFTPITRLGEGGLYLVPLALIFAAALWRRRTGLAWRSGFVFAAIALSGLVVDIVKPVFGRARPKLLFEQNLFGFTWAGPHADRWSFPSGHSATMAALAIALYAIYPRGWPAYAALALAVMTSRVVIEAHYLSDVIAGAYVGLAAAWALAAAARSRGVALALEPRAPASPIALEAVEETHLVAARLAAAQGDDDVLDRTR
ncbi:MAG: phosphatase PAP2 family protein [Stellaceae bacterium]